MAIKVGSRKHGSRRVCEMSTTALEDAITSRVTRARDISKVQAELLKRGRVA